LYDDIQQNRDFGEQSTPSRQPSASLNATTMIRNIALAVLFLVALAAWGQAARAEAFDDIVKAGRIRVAIAVGTPLFSYYDTSGQLAGSDVETASRLAKDLGVKLEVVAVPNAARIPTLQADKVDIVVADLAITPERAKTIDSSPPYAASTLIVAALKSVAARSYADLAGKNVGVTRATVNDIFRKYHGKDLPAAVRP
jgi:polar amino acid transport system substrate-binding protein